MAITTVASGRKTIKDLDNKGTATDTYNIGTDATSVTISGKMTKGDVINIEGLASEYTASASGRTITFKSDTQTIKFQLSATSGESSIRFLDGDLKASYGGTKVGASLGTQKLTTKAAAINDEALGALDSTAVEFAVSSSTASTTYTLTAAAASAEEGSTATFVLTLDKAPTSAVTINYLTSNGTSSTNDITPVSGTVTFAAGQITQYVNIATCCFGTGSSERSSLLC